MPGFVIEYHRPSGDRRVTEFPGENGHREALQYRLALERERVDGNWEIASLNSQSLEMLQRTHRRYFQGRELLSA